MQCPIDQSNMEKVTLDSKYGSKITIDQCNVCGGVWFDDSELYLAKESESQKIKDVTSLNKDRFKQDSQINFNELRCPKDGNILIRYKDTFLPEKIFIMRCPCCNGLWLDKAEFAEFQTYRSDIADVSSIKEQDREFEYEMNKYLNQYSKESKYETLGKVGSFFSNPIKGGLGNNSIYRGVRNTIITIVVLVIVRLLLFFLFQI